MVQENFSNHVINCAILGSTLQNQETKVHLPSTLALYLGDGQEGVNGFPIGAVESMFIVGHNYSPFIEFNPEQSGKFALNMLDFIERERKRTHEQWYVSLNQPKGEYTYQNLTRKIADLTPENRNLWYYHAAVPDLLLGQIRFRAKRNNLQKGM